MLIAHLSDPHLRPPGLLYQGLVDSNAMFETAIDCLNALDPAPDLVLISGDLVDEGTAAEYATAREAFARIRQPLLAIPGNHDEPGGFRACMADRMDLPSAGPMHFAAGGHGAVRIVGLDVTVPGEHHGAVDDATCRWLADALQDEPDRPTILMMHQPPFESGISFIDRYNCRGGDRLAALLARYSNVERVVCGHIHRFIQLRFGGTMLVTAPSTTTAIALRLAEDAEPASFVEPPALLLHHWKPGRGLVTHFVPIGDFPGPLPFF
ncbi:3',5'-cyclic AMP phosphodiesterase CpdA [Faunimonas pinastri]|uniref:3',5'-cyclic AMP phosphodiesterase CpdA n=1 Tax=Faunimonas pinastri TaxID=1855383 RepID=A0A1H9MH76_9HYPH|nr:phosphodiesterase [Faunimonas pinastri]SER23042.1 3',5'-cyclic AMP phosphodiesterase CpdA [Faunimonas pinastri]